MKVGVRVDRVQTLHNALLILFFDRQNLSCYGFQHF